jgi:hypothetical protein
MSKAHNLHPKSLTYSPSYPKILPYIYLAEMTPSNIGLLKVFLHQHHPRFHRWLLPLNKRPKQFHRQLMRKPANLSIPFFVIMQFIYECIHNIAAQWAPRACHLRCIIRSISDLFCHQVTRTISIFREVRQFPCRPQSCSAIWIFWGPMRISVHGMYATSSLVRVGN